MSLPEAAQLLAVLAEYPQGASLPRLAKRLGVRASTLMRLLAPLGEDPLGGNPLGDSPQGGMPGPGWVAVRDTPGGWTACLTEAGRQALAQARQAPGP
ncbi:helix-turn-helix domain-containing protein [Orrella sp. JC864]|uniref:helix-turn-helix domain-containing protein n=1 Tax=Orrella sp. JC864 TaxID=3120298 RepID=UPI003009DBEC